MNLSEIKSSMEALRCAYQEAGGVLVHDAKHNPCPICDDKTGFSLFTDKEGRARWKCHSKCGGAGGSVIDFLMAKHGMSSKDAVQHLKDRYGDTPPPKAKPSASSARKDDKKGRFFGSAMEAEQFWIDVFARDGGEHQFTWRYDDQFKGNWEPVLQVVRCRMPNGKKELRPSRRVSNGWRTGLGTYGERGRPLPLLNKRKLMETVPARDLHIAEGEKCADALGRCGVLATTACQGSSYADRSDWSPATRFDRVIIWQDVDETNPKTGVNPGKKYVDTVMRMLAECRPPERTQNIQVVDLRLQGLQDGEDVADLVEAMEMEGKAPEEIFAGLVEVVDRCAASVLGELYPGQPPPLSHDFGSFGQNEERPPIRNWRPEERKVKVKEKGEDGHVRDVEKTKILPMQVSPLTVVDRVLELTGNAVCRIRAPGAREPLLFLETRRRQQKADAPAFPRVDGDQGKSFSGGACEGRIQFVQNGSQFRALTQRVGRLQFEDKRDPERTNYATTLDVFHTFAEAHQVNEYEAIQIRPHMPPMPGHYYAWRPPEDYRPTGERLAGLLKFFTNAKSPEDLALIAAAIITPGWGGTKDVRYGCRPLLVLTAADQGSGKTTIAQIIGDLWGGWLPVALTQRAEDEFIQRALSPGGLLTRVAVIDNVLGTLKSGAIEAWITEKYIRGKRLYQGDASRPNDLTWLVTLNNARLSRDMAERAYFINLVKPEKRADWAKDCATYVSQHGAEIVLDALAILATPMSKESLGLSDRWAVWAEEVLARACISAAVKEVVGDSAGVDVRAVLGLTNDYRTDCDVDKEQAEEVWLGILERLSLPYIDWSAADDRRIISMPDGWDKEGKPNPAGAKEHIFVPSGEMIKWLLAIQGRRELNSSWVRTFIEGHHRAGRLPHVWYHREKGQRGYRVAVAGLVEYLVMLSENPDVGPQSPTTGE